MRVKQWIDGIGHVRGQLESSLASAGVAPIDQTGVPFDPTMHDAMMMQKAEKDQAPGMVAKVLEPGWKLHDRVIRPAKVAVTE
jgi:molecular chaperone GrpE